MQQQPPTTAPSLTFTPSHSLSPSAAALLCWNCWENKRQPCCWLLFLLLMLGCVRDTQCLLYNSIESYSTHELLKIRALQKEATRLWETATTAATATATATATTSGILHTFIGCSCCLRQQQQLPLLFLLHGCNY